MHHHSIRSFSLRSCLTDLRLRTSYSMRSSDLRLRFFEVTPTTHPQRSPVTLHATGFTTARPKAMLSVGLRTLRPVLRSSCSALTLKLLVARSMASKSSSDLLINEPKYSWLKELSLQADNPGVFDGTWHANGPVRL